MNNDFKKPARLIDHPGNDYSGQPAAYVADLKTPELRSFKVALENDFSQDKQYYTVVTAQSPELAAAERGEAYLRNVSLREDEQPENDAYTTVYVQDTEGNVTAWVVTAHISITFSSVPGAL